MAKKKENKKGGKSSQPSTPVAPKEQLQDLSLEVEKVMSEYTLPQEYTEYIDRESVSPEIAEPDLDASIAEVKHLVKDLLERQNGLRKAEGFVDAEREKLTNERETLVSEREEFQENSDQLQERLLEFESREEELSERDKALTERESEIVRRECDADSGFLLRNKDFLASIKQEHENILNDIASNKLRYVTECQELGEALHQKRLRLFRDHDRIRTELKSKLAEKFQSLKSREHDIVEDEKRLRKLNRKLELDQEILNEEQKAVKDSARVQAASEVAKRDAEIGAQAKRLEVVLEQLALRDNVLAERDEVERQLGGRTLKEMRNELSVAKKEQDKLKQQLAERLSPKDTQRLSELERMREQWETDEVALRHQVSSLKHNLSLQKISVTELETLRNILESLKASNSLYEQAINERTAEMSQLLDSESERNAFPACKAMDIQNSERHTGSQPLHKLDLKTFAANVRAHMASAATPLYYSERDVRSFIAGLAASRLHILQGISGTGKTSLPKAFCNAISAGHALIPVQAGWRDRQDLIGHYNSFSKQFHETEFTQALYRAGCPSFADKPFIIVLDEMNLSHPEQYFADLLSALELPSENQKLDLMTSPAANSPELFVEGRSLRIPPNVWFVGTANHDETTKDFADKTYDRAHVMELPRHPESIQEDHRRPMAVAYDWLNKVFMKAKDDFGDEADVAYQFLENNLAELFEKNFAISWGNRLQRQMKEYVPLVVACGGTLGEATDHILATKILRKLRDRYANRSDDIRELDTTIATQWKTLNDKSTPTKSREILNAELRRLGAE